MKDRLTASEAVWSGALRYCRSIAIAETMTALLRKMQIAENVESVIIGEIVNRVLVLYVIISTKRSLDHMQNTDTKRAKP